MIGGIVWMHAIKLNLPYTCGSMEPTGLNTNRFAQLSGGPMSLEEDE